MSIRHLLNLCFALSFSSTAIAQPASPELRAVRAAGAYLGSIEYLHALKATECSYAIRKTAPNVDDVVANEVMPSFEAATRAEIAKTMVKLKPELKRQAQNHIRTLLSDAGKDKTLDMKSRCGYVAGVIATTYERARDAWLTAVREMK